MKVISHGFTKESVPEILPVIPTMDVVVFPHAIVPLLVLDERIINGVQKALEESKMVMLLAAKKQAQKNQGAVGTKDLYNVGTIASIMRLIRVPEGGIKILVQGLFKAQVKEIIATDQALNVMVESYSQEEEFSDQDPEIFLRVKAIKEVAEKISSLGTVFSPDFHAILSKMHDPQKIADFVLSHLTLDIEAAQELLEQKSIADFLDGVYQHLKKEIEVHEVKEKLQTSARDSMNQSHKEFFLREQLKAIKKELGEDDFEDIEALRARALEVQLTPEARTELTRQINRLERTSPDSMEASVIRNYVDWMLALPWGKESVDNLEIAHAKAVLDEDHYGLDEIKDRILDFISIKNLKQDGYAPIICFVGPPGTGKTSLGKSIARSLGREYFRVSLGGVKDEAEIRGHRRTYVGAMPGRFIQGMRKVATCNPVVIIDELDKIGSDFRGDPSAALLELLDPQQNKTFYDNYLGVSFDLSKVMFIATANTLETISEPLRDRMEVIQLSGYTSDEKLHIVKSHLLRRAIRDCGLEKNAPQFSEELITDVILHYTKEAGVRQLERALRKLCCKVARCMVEQNRLLEVNAQNLEQYLGPRKFVEDLHCIKPQIGISNGLAWTMHGGEMLKIEAVIVPGKGKLILTGQLGNVMRESAQAALTYARAHSKEFGIPDKMFTNYDLHIHVPAGATPKDGPSAGITLLSSILSVFTQRPLNAHFAMTGELNLRGEVMPIGGVKEKILAAKRNKVANIILPQKNKGDLVGLDELLKDINLILVDNAQEVMNHVLLAGSESK